MDLMMCRKVENNTKEHSQGGCYFKKQGSPAERA